jgi:hypothetical protein
MRRITSAICSSTGKSWLGSETRLVVANTAVIESSSGIAAATAEPNTNSRITSVSGRAIMATFANMLLNASVVAFSVVTLPMCSTSMPGCRASTLSTAALIVSM